MFGSANVFPFGSANVLPFGSANVFPFGLANVLTFGSPNVLTFSSANVFPPTFLNFGVFYPSELKNVSNTNRLNFLEEGQTIIMQVYDKINEFIIVG